MPPIEDDEELKKGKKNQLTRLPVFLVLIKAGNGSYKLEIKIKQMLYLLFKEVKITKGI